MFMVVCACRDLMTASRLQLQAGVDVQVVTTADGAVDACSAAGGSAVLLVDLVDFADLPRRVRDAGTAVRAVVGFAPHVRTELLDAARPWADRVLARGAVMRDLRGQLERIVPSGDDAQHPEQQ